MYVSTYVCTTHTEGFKMYTYVRTSVCMHSQHTRGRYRKSLRDLVILMYTYGMFTQYTLMYSGTSIFQIVNYPNKS